MPTVMPQKFPAVVFLFKSGGISFYNPATLFVGEIGIGKSTILESIAATMEFNAEGGSKDFSFSTQDTHSDLCDNLTTI